ncbi:hydroxymethylbilane synthase [Streptomyces sp. NPDC098101]|uniref:hydroxymethylbilane synthase n=1 Tax=Streptomyces sp. NPDC098101 TaxID=3366096 RepID=UPI00380A7055
MSLEVLRIGTRSSPMALAQVARLRKELAALRPDVRTEVVDFTTSGDRWSGALSQLGGKGAFTRELDEALVGGAVDLAVHCVKDVPGDVPVARGTVFAAHLRRDSLHDALVEPGGRTLDRLPPGSVLGTSSVRRIAQLARTHPHLTAKPIRGNANTRLAKLDSGEYDALLLAVCGLERIGAAERITEVLPLETMMPAVGSGTLVVQCREGDTEVLDAVAPLGHPDTHRETEAERTLLHCLQGHCNSPIAAFARTEPDGRIGLRARVFSPDGKEVVDAHEWGRHPQALGTSVAATLIRDGALEIIRAIPH